jgi:hypothetical protein
MIDQYADAVGGALSAVLEFAVRLALPMTILVGVAAAIAALLYALRPQAFAVRAPDSRRVGGLFVGWAGVLLLIVAGWAALRTILPVAREDVRWRQAKEATTNPAPDAPAVEQYGPSVATLVEHTYTRTLTLPPDFAQRLGTEGLGVIAPYMTDPTAENVLHMVDTFRRSGKDLLFTREATRIDEESIPLLRSLVSVKFKRLASRAYESEFEGRYTFQNNRADAVNTRLVFPLPVAGTVRDVSLVVGGQTVAEPGVNGAYEWKSRLAPGEMKEAVARYRVVGARSWSYDLGSQRRRVQQFRLDATPGGPVKYRRASLQPTSTEGRGMRWDLSNVVTGQRIALEFPPDTAATQCYLQAVSAIPAAFVLFLLAATVIGFGTRRGIEPSAMAIATVVCALGFGAAPVLSNYVGSVAGLIVGPVLGAIAAASILRGRSWLAIPVALMPAAFLSPQHSGLILLAIAVASLVAARLLAGGRGEPNVRAAVAQA